MATAYDLESILSDLEELLQGLLNLKLNEIDAEKDDGITLKELDTNAFHFQTLNQKNANYNPIILYGVEGAEAQPIGPATLHKYNLSVVVALADNGQDRVIVKRLLRYQRAIKEVIHENWDRLNNGVNLMIRELPPDLNNAEGYKVIGLMLEATIG